MDQLKKELNEINIDNNTKNTILNVFSSWKNCKDNHQYIDNLQDAKINFGYNYSINYSINSNDVNYNKNYDKEIEINKRTLYIDNCKNLEVEITNKFNHIVLINSANINIVILDGLISGLDIIRCNNCKITIKNKQFLVSFSNSYDCNLIVDNIYDFYVNTDFCCNIILNLILNNKKKDIITNKSLFSKNNLFHIDNNLLCTNYFGEVVE